MFKDRVYEQSTSTGTGNFTLGGAVTGYQSFSSAFTASTDAYYLIVNRAVPTEWEVGKYTVGGTTLARISGNVFASSDGASTLVNFSAGTKDVFNSIPAVAMQGIDPGTLLSTVRQPVYQDITVNNCGGTIPNSNCQSNPNWAMPNANWWTWGLGLSYGNPSNFDFAGGSTTANNPVSQVNQKIYSAYTLYQNQVGYDIYRRNQWNCNCGATNCYSNCNCNCNCDCNCTCNSCCSCFPAGTRVLLATGDWKNIEDLQPGDVLRGLGGEANNVKGLWKPVLGPHRRLYEINGEFRTTGDHLLWTEGGWGAIQPELYQSLRYESLSYHEETKIFIQGVIDPAKLSPIAEGISMPVEGGESRKLETLRIVEEAGAETQLFCPILDGNQSFVLQGGYYADGLLGVHIPAEALTPQNLALWDELRGAPALAPA